jgi:hypothetical protein
MSDPAFAFPRFNRVFEQAELLDRMMETLAADRLPVIRCDGGAAWQTARLRCVDCVHDRRCRAWLDTIASRGAEEAPAFCANADFLRTGRTRKA